MGPSRPFFNQNPIPLHSLPLKNWHSPQINTHLDCYPLQNILLMRNIPEGNIALSILPFIYCIFILQGSEHCNGLWISTSLITNQNSNRNLFHWDGCMPPSLLLGPMNTCIIFIGCSQLIEGNSEVILSFMPCDFDCFLSLLIC